MLLGAIGVAIVAGVIGSMAVLLTGGGFLAALGVYSLTGTFVLLMIVASRMIHPAPPAQGARDAEGVRHA